MLSRGRQHRASLLKSDNASWNFTKRKIRSDAISEEQKKLVYDFWSSPGVSSKSDIKRMRTGPKQFVSHAVYVLENTQT